MATFTEIRGITDAVARTHTHSEEDIEKILFPHTELPDTLSLNSDDLMKRLKQPFMGLP